MMWKYTKLCKRCNELKECYSRNSKICIDCHSKSIQNIKNTIKKCHKKPFTLIGELYGKEKKKQNQPNLYD